MHRPDRGVGATPQRCPLSVVGGNVEWAWGEDLLSPAERGWPDWTCSVNWLLEPEALAYHARGWRKTKTKNKVKEITYLRKRPYPYTT